MAKIPTVIRSDIRAILPVIRQRLLDRQILNSATVLYAARGRELPVIQADQTIYLIPGRLTNLESVMDGQGRWITNIRRWLDIVPRIRLNLDEPDRDTEKLLNETLGYLQLEEQIVDALHMFFPEDEDGNHLTREPMRLADGEEPSTGRGDASWMDAAIRFEIQYMLALDQTQ